MGGAIFTKGANPLYVPRMPPQVYTHILNFCQVQLRQLFIAVTTPIEGPAKTSFGDVDIALAWPRTEYCSSQDAWKVRRSLSDVEILEAAARLIGGVRVDKVRNSKGVLGEVHVAVPWPKEFRALIPPKESGDSDLAGSGKSDAQGSEIHHTTPTPDAYIQVDLHIWPDLPTLQWLLFKHAHGDLWNILGPTIRALGLTADETGLHLRIPEIEKHDIKRARILLSSDPAQVLAFLGMAGGSAKGEPWAGQFTTKKEFFEYATSNRFFCGGVMFPPTKYADQDDTVGDSAGTSNRRKEAKNDNESRYAEDKKKPLRSNERRRIKYRPLFAEFLSDFLPEKRREAAAALSQSRSHLTSQVHVEGTEAVEETTDQEKSLQAALESQFPHTRASVREECFAYFGPTIRWDYDRTLKAWTIEKQRMSIKRDIIKTIVPPPEAVVGGQVDNASTTLAVDTVSHETICPTTSDPAAAQHTRPQVDKEQEDDDPWNGERLPPSFRGQITSALSKIVLDGDFSTFTDQHSAPELVDIQRRLALPTDKPLRDEVTGLYNEDHIREYVTESWRKVAEILRGKNAVAFKAGGWQGLDKKRREKETARK